MRKIYFLNKEIIDSWIKKYDVLNWPKREKKFEWQAGKNERNIKNSIITLRQSGIRCKAKPIYPTLVAMVQIPIIFDIKLNNYRYITVKEASKLQSFNSKYKWDHQKAYLSYKQLGNAVNVNVVKKVIEFYINNKNK